MTTLPTLLAELRRRVASARKYTPKTHADGDGITTVPTVMLDDLLAHIDALSAVVERQREFLAQVAKQIPEKPDYWSSCGQCERNSSDAEDLIELTPATALRLHEAEVRMKLLTEMKTVFNEAIHWEDVREWIDDRLRAGREG